MLPDPSSVTRSPSPTRRSAPADALGGRFPSSAVTVAAAGLPAATPGGSVPNVSVTVSRTPSPSAIASTAAVAVRSPAANRTNAGTAKWPVSPAAESGTFTSRSAAWSSSTATSTAAPSSTAYDARPNDTASRRCVVADVHGDGAPRPSWLYARTATRYGVAAASPPISTDLAHAPAGHSTPVSPPPEPSCRSWITT